jgi:PKD repeat protein
MRSKLFVTFVVALLLVVGLVSQVFAAGANAGQKSMLLAVNTATRTRTATKAPTSTRTRTPTKSPTPSLTPVPVITGSVLIHGGACCMGGPVGTTINIDIAFSATSTAGAVTDMRVGYQGSCTINQDLSLVAWEPYATSKIIAYKIIAINWVGFYTSVQYRDAAGNISPTYCDDISIEGSPATTGTPGTGTPTPATKTPTPTLTSVPGADFSATPLSGAAPLTVQFTALNSSVLSSCTWNFGDGVTQTFTGSFHTCPTTTHTYTTAGSYNVTLSVMKVTGAYNSMTKTNYIQVTGTSATLTPTGTPTLPLTPTRTPTLPQGT